MAVAIDKEFETQPFDGVSLESVLISQLQRHGFFVKRLSGRGGRKNVSIGRSSAPRIPWPKSWLCLRPKEGFAAPKPLFAARGNPIFVRNNNYSEFTVLAYHHTRGAADMYRYLGSVQAETDILLVGKEHEHSRY